MKKRRVTVTLEIETDAPLKILRDAPNCWGDFHMYSVKGDDEYSVIVIQAQANVIREKK